MIFQALFLAVAWVALQGEITRSSLIEALIIGLLCSLTLGRNTGSLFRFRIHKTFAAIHLTLYFLWELVLSNVRVAMAVIRGNESLSPAIVDVPLDLEQDAAIALVANLVTLTPGTLSVDVASDDRVLYVHTLDGADPEAVRQDIHSGFEKRVKALFS